MMRSVKVAHDPVDAAIRIPGSKSITNRALICAALAEGESVLMNASDSDDTALMVNGLNQLGILVRKEKANLLVAGKGGRVYAPRYPIPTGNAGTTLRFLMGLAALADGTVVFEGGGRMSERPIDPLVDGLRQLGVECDAMEFAGRFAVKGGGLQGGGCRIASDISSQFLSSLLMVSPYARADVRIEPLGELVSGAYLTMTRAVMNAFQVTVDHDSRGEWIVRYGQRYKAARFGVEPDFSAAAVFFCAAMIAGGKVRIEQVVHESIQGDAEILDILTRLGGSAQQARDGLVFSAGQGRDFPGITIDMRNTPDLVPALTSVLLFATTPSRIHGIGHLRFKESDRLSVMSSELSKTGADIRVMSDGIEIFPALLTGANLNPHDDHRLAMSFALIGLRVPGMSIGNPECVRKSFPGFWAELEKLEGKERA